MIPPPDEHCAGIREWFEQIEDAVEAHEPGRPGCPNFTAAEVAWYLLDRVYGPTPTPPTHGVAEDDAHG